MSTQFRPLEIPPGVVSNPTKQMRSSNWAEVNLMRWVEGQLTPVGGQAAYTYGFASRCKLIHGWYDLSDVYHIAYLCEANLYVDTGGVLVDITPGGGITPPQPLTEGGYGDGAYGQNVVLAVTAAWAPGPPVSRSPPILARSAGNGCLQHDAEFTRRHGCRLHRRGAFFGGPRRTARWKCGRYS